MCTRTHAPTWFEAVTTDRLAYYNFREGCAELLMAASLLRTKTVNHLGKDACQELL